MRRVMKTLKTLFAALDYANAEYMEHQMHAALAADGIMKHADHDCDFCEIMKPYKERTQRAREAYFTLRSKP